jgi:hypothetical protein
MANIEDEAKVAYNEDVKMSCSQSKHLNTIKDAMNRGEIITHILNWKTSREPTAEIGNLILDAMYKIIQDKVHTYTVNRMQNVSIIWIMTESSVSSSYYYTESGYSDRVTKAHVKIMITSAVRALKEDDRYQALRNKRDNWGVSYLVTKPLDYGGGEVAGQDVN